MWLIAQVDPVTATFPTTIIGSFIFITVSLVGVIVWIVRTDKTVTFPSMLAEMKAQREANDTARREQNESNEKNITQILEVFSRTNDKEREMCTQQFAAVNAAIAGLSQGIMVNKEQIINGVNKHTTEQAQIGRHDLNNTIHEAVLTREVHQALQKQKQGQTPKPNDRPVQP